MSEYVHRIFSSVYRNYDAVNSFCSLGTIILWRRTAASEAVISRPGYKVLDIATGTGELAFEVLKKANRTGKDIEVTGMDFNSSMLKVAKQKADNRDAKIKFEIGDAMKLRYGDNSFDVVTSAFALRNVDSLEKFASESRRVLKKGGKFVFMDMARPDSALGRLFLGTFWAAVGVIGILEDRVAYDWLVSSVDRFDKAGFVRILKKAGFRNVKSRNVISGAAFLVTGYK